MSNFSLYIEMSKKIRSLQTAPKVWNYIKYRCLKRKTVMSVRRYTPQIGALLLTSRCNLNCGYCGAAKILRETNGRLLENDANLEKVQRIFTNPLFANCLLVELQGGEPLLVEDLDRIVAYLTRRGHITNIITNGLLLADRIADLKNAGVSRIEVSLYNENQTVMKRDLAKINRTFPVNTSIMLLRSMVEKMPDKLLETARFVHDTGCRGLHFLMYRPIGLNPKPEEVIRNTDPAYLEFRRRAEDVLPGFCSWHSTVNSGTVKKLCPQLWQRIMCDMLGNVVICCGIGETLKGPNSNLFKTEPNILLNHPMLVNMRKQLIDPKCDSPDICKICNLLDDPGW